MTPYNAAFFGLYQNVFLELREQFEDESALSFMRNLFSRALKPAYDSMGFEKGNPFDFARVVKERDDGVGLRVEFPKVSSTEIIYQFHTDPFPGLKGKVESKLLDDCYLAIKIDHILGSEWTYRTTKHFWKGDGFTEHIITRNSVNHQNTHSSKRLESGNMDFELLIASHLRNQQEYIPGLSISEIKCKYGVAEVIKLASNEMPVSPSPQVIAAISAAASESNRYPEYSVLKARLADLFSLTPSHILLGNGSIDVLDIIFKCLARSESHIVCSSHSYFAYRLLAQKSGLGVVDVPSKTDFCPDVEALIAACNSQTAMLVVDSPGNFSGSVLENNDLLSILRRIPKTTMFVLDQAYIDFDESNSVTSPKLLLEEFPNLIITRTFSKVYCLASLRVGYALSHPHFIRYLNRVQQTFPVSHRGVVAAVAALNDRQYTHFVRDLILNGREQLLQAFIERGLKTYPSQGNFVLVCFGKKATDLYKTLLKRGIICRQMTSYSEPDFIRFSVGTKEQNEILLKNIEELMNEFN